MDTSTVIGTSNVSVSILSSANTDSAVLLRNGTVVKTWSQRANKEDTIAVERFHAYKAQMVSGSDTYQLHANYKKWIRVFINWR
ncbi:MAG: hypothetical protein PHG06_13515 [Parabacteroides sp.]|nr:hypothetical protein [Parabacteroides sp.]